MKKNKLNIVTGTILSFCFLIHMGCSDYLDVNTDPNKVSDVGLNVLLPSSIEATASVHYNSVGSASRVAHQVYAYSGYYQEFQMSSSWATIYLTSLNNLKTMVEKAKDTEKNSPHYLGITRILQAINLAMATDTWENVPYSEGLSGSLNITPKYDTQEELYTTIMNYLDEAITELNKTESYYKPGSDDLIYEGDIDSWKKLAYSLKARYMLHLVKKGVYTYANILADISKGFQSNDDNFQLLYNSVNKNPYYEHIALSNQTGNFTYTHSDYLINLMNGTIYGVDDPRLKIIADNDTFATYVGFNDWDASAPSSTVQISTNTWYANASSPVLMMTYAELKFIEAEAAFSSGDLTRAKTAYDAGIGAHCDMLGVTAADKSAYLSDAAVNVTDLEHIMKEKYLALFLHFEAWNDMRRHNFDTTVYKGFVEPNINDRNVPAQRALYPTSEINRNGSNAKANFKEFTAKMWLFN